MITKEYWVALGDYDKSRGGRFDNLGLPCVSTIRIDEDGKEEIYNIMGCRVTIGLRSIFISGKRDSIDFAKNVLEEISGAKLHEWKNDR